MNASAVAQLEDIYARLPKVACRGKCQAHCGPIDMTAVERHRIREASGVTIPAGNSDDTYTCPALGMLGQCTVYEMRPLICRAFGGIEDLKCGFGCEPEGPHLTREQWMNLWADAMVAAGEMTPAHADRFRTHLSDPRAMELYDAAAKGVRGAAYELHKHLRGVINQHPSAHLAGRANAGLARLELRLARM